MTDGKLDDMGDKAPTGPEWARVEALLGRGVADGVFPGAVLSVGAGDDVVAEIAVGTIGGNGVAATGDGADPRPTDPGVVYDLASLTKPLVTVASVALLLARGRLALDDSVAKLVPDFVGPGPHDAHDRAAVTVRRLLSHSSGLPAYRRYFEQLDAADSGSPRELVELVCREPLERPVGRSSVYSDLGFIVLGDLVERVAGVGLDRFFETELARPLGLETARFVTGTPIDAAPCGLCPWRRRVIRGVVQDENAYAMGGVAGHAGLFGTAGDVHALVAEHVRALAGAGRVLDGGVVGELWEPDDRVADTTWALGWDTPTPGASSAGSLVSPDAVGHLGYTGTSVWVDRTRGVHVVLLTNRVHPDPKHQAIRAFRPLLHDAVLRACDSSV